MPTDQMMWELGKHWDIPAQCKFNDHDDVIRRSGDLIFFPKSNILCDLQSHTPQIYMYVLIILFYVCFVLLISLMCIANAKAYDGFAHFIHNIYSTIE